MNRLHQLKQTLPKNLEWNRRHKDIVEFVLADIGPTDGLLRWALEHFYQDISCGYLKIVKVEASSWHASWAKNTSHAAASSPLLVNLDGDVMMGPQAGVKLIRAFRHQRGQAISHLANGRGTYGCIAYPAEMFWGVGGYNQALHPMGGQDVDLLARLAIKFGVKILICDHKTKGAGWLKSLWPLGGRGVPRLHLDKKGLPRPSALRNSKLESVANIKGRRLRYGRMNRENLRTSEASIRSKRLNVNKGQAKGWAFIRVELPKELQSLEVENTLKEMKVLGKEMAALKDEMATLNDEMARPEEGMAKPKEEMKELGEEEGLEPHVCHESHPSPCLDGSHDVSSHA